MVFIKQGFRISVFVNNDLFTHSEVSDMFCGVEFRCQLSVVPPAEKGRLS